MRGRNRNIRHNNGIHENNDNNNRTVNESGNINDGNSSHTNIPVSSEHTTDDNEYDAATSYFIRGAIDTTKSTIEQTAELIEFIKYTVKDFLWWARIYRTIFIIKEVINIIKILYELLI